MEAPSRSVLGEKRLEFQPLIENTNLNKYKVIEVTLTSTGSKYRDALRLRKVHGFLTSIPGKDKFAFLCKVEGQIYRIDFPNDSTTADDIMLKELCGMVGETNVQII